jgi:hypothetical protein
MAPFFRAIAPNHRSNIVHWKMIDQVANKSPNNLQNHKPSDIAWNIDIRWDILWDIPWIIIIPWDTPWDVP